jgi:hypothetical protein
MFISKRHAFHNLSLERAMMNCSIIPRRYFSRSPRKSSICCMDFWLLASVKP